MALIRLDCDEIENKIVLITFVLSTILRFSFTCSLEIVNMDFDVSSTNKWLSSSMNMSKRGADCEKLE